MNVLLVLPSLFQNHSTKETLDEQELELVKAAKADIQAFGLLYEKYMPAVYRYTRARVLNEQDAADLTQQTFMNAIHSLHRYQSKGVPFAAWLFRIAQYTLRQKQRKEKSTIPWQLLPEVMHPLEEISPESTMLQHEQLVSLGNLLKALKPEHRDLLALRFAAGLSSSEIAAVIGKKPDAVKKQLSRILNQLKEGYKHNA